MEYIHWKYDGTGNCNMNKKIWIKNIKKDLYIGILSNYDLIKYLSIKNNLSIDIFINNLFEKICEEIS